MAGSRFSKRILTLIGLGVAVPALLLAVLGVFLTLRISREVEREGVHYNEYIARQVAEAFERELMAYVKSGVVSAETAIRDGEPMSAVLSALEDGSIEFEGGPHFVPVDSLDGHSLLMVEGQPLLFAPAPDNSGRYFVGTLLRRADATYIGAGGWWFDPGQFIRDHTDEVIQERMPANPRMYGGLEQTRRLSIQVLDSLGHELGRVRTPHTDRTAVREPMSGPFERYLTRVAPTASAPVVWTDRFVVLEIAFISIMALAIGLASTFGLRYTIRQLELAQLKSSFVSNVSHELKTPIALIRLAVETLELGRVSSEADKAKFIGTISRETIRLSRLVDNILDFARLEAGQKVFRFESVDILDLVRETLDSFRLRLEDQGFAIVIDLPDSLPHARADATALTHCLLNLLDNAMKYSRQRREVRVSAGTEGEYVAISVADRGIGISPTDQERIFEKFVRVETGLVHDVKGAGLGLSLVDQIMRAHGGRVRVTSVLGEGSTFTLLVPRAEEPVTVPDDVQARTESPIDSRTDRYGEQQQQARAHHRG